MKYGRNEIIALYLYQQTGVLRSPRQCGSKLQHLFTCEEISEYILVHVLKLCGIHQYRAPSSPSLTESAVENYQPAPDASKREEILTCLLPLVPLLRSAQAERPPTPPPRKGRPYSGPKAENIKITSGATSTSFSLLGYSARTDPAAIISGAAALELSDMVPRTPVLKAHIVLPPNLDVDSWSGVHIELAVPGANSVEYHTLTWIAETSGPDCLVKATPTTGSRFTSPVAPGSLSDILRVWSSEQQRRQLMPDVSVVQRFKARRKGGKMNKDDFVVVVYSLEVAKQECDASIIIRPAIVIPPSTTVKALPFPLHAAHGNAPLQTTIAFTPRPLQLNLPAPSFPLGLPRLELATPYAYPDPEVYCEPLLPDPAASAYSDTSPTAYTFSASSAASPLCSPSATEDPLLPPSPVPIRSIPITAPKPRPPNPFEHVQWLGSSNGSGMGETANNEELVVQAQVDKGMSCNSDLAHPTLKADDLPLNATIGLDGSAISFSSSPLLPSSLEYHALDMEGGGIYHHLQPPLGNPIQYYLEASGQAFFQVPPFEVGGELALCS
ncbi:hypothetical protein FRC00_012805 [Tulasnella sp. 408]|nr:hypothetical protein FRC00_012805 [Tulasnella sp. 408]